MFSRYTSTVRFGRDGGQGRLVERLGRVLIVVLLACSLIQCTASPGPVARKAVTAAPRTSVPVPTRTPRPPRTPRPTPTPTRTQAQEEFDEVAMKLATIAGTNDRNTSQRFNYIVPRLVDRCPGASGPVTVGDWLVSTHSQIESAGLEEGLLALSNTLYSAIVTFDAAVTGTLPKKACVLIFAAYATLRAEGQSPEDAKGRRGCCSNHVLQIRAVGAAVGGTIGWVMETVTYRPAQVWGRGKCLDMTHSSYMSLGRPEVYEYRGILASGHEITIRYVRPS